MTKKQMKWWATAFFWCMVIALATRAPMFSGESTEMLLHNPFVDASFKNIVLRKIAHLLTFATLAVFVWFALEGKPLRYLSAWFLATGYGAIDEWHQSFIPDRSASLADVGLNSVGAFSAMVIVYLISQWKREQTS